LKMAVQDDVCHFSVFFFKQMFPYGLHSYYCLESNVVKLTTNLSLPKPDIFILYLW
jgi:hypothetical protein